MRNILGGIFMTVLDILVGFFVLIYMLADLLFSIRNLKYQKLWNKQKANIKRIDPAITRAELCEKYVLFCKKHKCKVNYE